MIKGEPILILLVDDDPAHSEAVRRALKASGMNVVIQPAGTLKEYRKIAAAHQPDIAILDLSLPDGLAVEALSSPPESGPFPIVVITSQGDEQKAVEAMKAGALDYIVKSPEAFTAMPRTVERVVQAWNVLQARKRAEQALRRAEENFRCSLDDSPLGVCISTAKGETIYANRAILDIYGYDSIEELRTTPIKNRYTPESYAEFQIRHNKRQQGEEVPSEYEISIVKKNGEVRHLHVFRKEVLWNNERQYQALYRDITERIRGEEAMREGEERYRTLIENVGEGIGFVNPEEQFAFANAAAEDIFGVPPSGLLGRSLREFAMPEQFGMIHEQTDRRRAGEKSVYEIGISRPNGEKRNLLITAVPQFDSQGQFVGTFGVFRDITERKRAEEALQKSEENFKALAENANDGILIGTGDEGWHVYANRRAIEITGYPIEELLKTCIRDLAHVEELPKLTERYKKRLAGLEVPKSYETVIVNKDGIKVPIEISPSRTIWQNQLADMVIFRDITERKRAEETVQASLREKEILLREIHHRVKNNMQVISSLFNLQAGYIKDEEALRILKEGQTRIRSMALVHEKLYQSGDLSKIDLAGYIQSLSTHLFHVYLVDPNQVRLETEFGDVTLDINSAVPCGLILNELISNVLKHAFPAGRKGVLMIRLRRGKDGAVELRIADNGVGFPKGLDFRRTESLGLQIVNLLVGQLEGTIKLAGKNGTAFTVAFHEIKQGLRI